MTTRAKARPTAEERAAALVTVKCTQGLFQVWLVSPGDSPSGYWETEAEAEVYAANLRGALAAALRDHERDLLSLALEALPARPVSEEREAEIRRSRAARDYVLVSDWCGKAVSDLLVLLGHARAERDACAAEAAWLRREEDVQRRIDEAVRIARHDGWMAGRKAAEDSER